MRRRTFISLLGGIAVAPPILWRLATRAQQPAIPVVAFLRDAAADGSEHFLAALRRGLREVGFVENQNVVVEYAWTEGHTDQLPALAADLVRRRVSVIVTSATNATIAAKAATSTIPIVFAVTADPVELKLVASLNRPGGNATGMSYLTAELAGKRLGLLRELAPAIADVTVLVKPDNRTAEISVRDAEAAARGLGLQVHVQHANTESDLDAVFATATQRRLVALLVVADPFFTIRRRQLVALAARHRVPAIYTAREFVDAGGLMSYGTSVPEVYRQVGVLCRPHPQGRKAIRFAGRAANKVRACHQPEDGQGARPCDASQRACDCRRGD